MSRNKASRSPASLWGREEAVTVNTQIELFSQYVNAVNQHLHIEKSVIHAYVTVFSNRLRSEGNTFLKLARGLYIQGLRVLGGERPTFDPSWTLGSLGYPVHFQFIFDKLCSLGYVVRSHKGRIGSSHNKIRLLLSLLYAPYGFKLALSKKNESDAIEAFLDRIQKVDLAYESDKALVLSSLLLQHVDKLVKSYPTGLSYLPENAAGKSRGPANSPLVPLHSVLATDTGFVNTLYTYNGPIGRATVLPERAGKSRVIVSYDGRVMSNNMRDNTLSVLNKIPGDFSVDQASGCDKVRAMTGEWLSDGRPIFSTDLSAFTDSLLPTAIYPLLERLDCEDFSLIQRAPIYVNGQVVHPNRYLMGLRGTFELSTIVHHGVAIEIAGVGGYAMCGDDLVFRGLPNFENFPNDWETIEDPTALCQRVDREGPESVHLAAYASICEILGLRLNESKTIASRCVAIFCGKAYFCGHDVTPFVPNFQTLSELDNRVDAQVAISGITTGFTHFPKACKKTFFKSLKRLVGHLFTGLPLPVGLPTRLGGFGWDNRIALCDLIVNPVLNSSYIRIPRAREDPEERRHNFPPFDEPKTFRATFSWMYNLGTGVVKRFKKPNRRASKEAMLSSFFSKEGMDICDLTDTLVYFYDQVPV